MAQRNWNSWGTEAQERENQGLCPGTRVILNTTPTSGSQGPALAYPTKWPAMHAVHVITLVFFPLHSQGNSAEEPSGVTSEGNSPSHFPTCPLKVRVLFYPHPTPTHPPTLAYKSILSR